MGFRVRNGGGNLFYFWTGLAGLLILPIKGHGCVVLLLFDRTRQGMVVKFITPSYLFFFLFLGFHPTHLPLTGSHQSAS